MRKFCLVLFGLFLCIDSVNAALRAQNTSVPTSSRQSRTKIETSTHRSISSRNAAVPDNVRKTTARTSSNKIITGRDIQNKKIQTRASTQTTLSARAAATVKTRTFGNNYNSCRDAYFTCMDQFCATQNEAYRRCVCSSKLKDIQNKEKEMEY